MPKTFAQVIFVFGLGLLLQFRLAAFVFAETPNVIWIISDDLGPELGCYGYQGVATPHIDRLAKSGCVYKNAFSTSPVCSSSRSALQTGRYQTSIGCHHHLTRDKKPLPATIPTAVDLLRAEGYFSSLGVGVVGNRSKAKFGVNFSINPKTYFDGYDWSQRKSGQPFFAQVHIKQPHRKFSNSNQDHPDASIPPYYPDHPLTRADWDAYLDSIELLDKKVGAILTQLEDEGLIDNTLIFFFGDHGRPHVRCKQWLYDGGIRTPMIVSWPKHVKPGTKEEALVSLLDVMPTTLKAAGISKIQLPGKDLLASDWQGHDVIFSARDRCGDAPDRIRSLRTSNLKYIKNFHPELPYLQFSSYKKLGYPVQTLMKVLHAEGRWDSPFMNSRRPEEELYDLTKDPFELNNVADQPEYRAKLIECRQRLERWILTTGDDGDKDESKTVDLEKVMVEKREWYEKTMRERGLDPEISDSDYLQWWFKEMRLESNN